MFEKEAEKYAENNAYKLERNCTSKGDRRNMKSTDFCHRHLVAKWLTTHLNLNVTEL